MTDIALPFRADPNGSHSIAPLRHQFAEFGLVDPELLEMTWKNTLRPLEYAPAEEWTAWFRSVGYLNDGEFPDAPTRPVTVYRGGFRYGMSWTLSKAVARLFAANHRASGRGHPAEYPTDLRQLRVHQKTVPASAVLAIFTGTDEAEVVLDLAEAEVDP